MIILDLLLVAICIGLVWAIVAIGSAILEAMK